MTRMVERARERAAELWLPAVVGAVVLVAVVAVVALIGFGHAAPSDVPFRP